jgi:hypothetical protein
MHTTSRRISNPVRLALAATCAFATLAASAQPIVLVPGTVNMFRDTRGANDVGIGQGDLFQFGADIVGGSLGVTLGATASTGFVAQQFDCGPLAVNPNFCARATGFSANRLDPWTFKFVRGTDSLLVAGPSVRGAEVGVPFPVSVSLSGGGVAPTLAWSVPSGFTPNGFRINVFDKGVTLANGQFDVIHSVAISPNALSYKLPTILSSGQALKLGGNYTVNLQLIDTRDDLPFANNNAQILRRSSSFFAFTPLDDNAPPNVHLPTVVNGVYNFSIENVGASSVTFIDPLVAIGYDYATGATDPDFASVLLPNIGDGQFVLEFDANAVHQTVALGHDVQYFFPQGGVNNFRVTGIETSAMLDPTNATAFITGLTFESTGGFTGTMTPLTTFVAGVPEPEVYALMALGLLVVGGVTRRRRARC